jgi:hypothetical protein
VQLFVFKNSQQLGPFTLEQVRCKESSGELLPTDLARLAHEQSWKALETFTKESPTPLAVIKTIFVRRGTEAFGPYSREEVTQYLTAGNVQHTDEARKGDDPNWQSISALLGIAPPPPKPAAPSQYCGPSHALFSQSKMRSSEENVWFWFSISTATAFALFIGWFLFGTKTIYSFSLDEDAREWVTTRRGTVLLLLAGSASLVSFGLFAMLLHRFWLAMDVAERQVKPSHAAGFMFIPIFNFYWQFVAVRGLAVEVNKALEAKGISGEDHTALATALCVLFCGAWIPWIGFFLALGSAVCAIIFWRAMVELMPELQKNPNGGEAARV